MLTKKQYLQVRPVFKSGNIALSFLKVWCEEEKRDFSALEVLLHEASQRDMFLQMQRKQVRFIPGVAFSFLYFFDRKFEVVVITQVTEITTKQTVELKVY